jgi:hypothetical protein
VCVLALKILALSSQCNFATKWSIDQGGKVKPSSELKKNLIRGSQYLLAVIVSGISAQAVAQYNPGQSAEIIYSGLETQGQKTLFLRQDLRNQAPYFNQQDFEIERVVLIAKSEHGRGEAQLEIGGRAMDRKVIAGHPSQFYNRDPRTFAYIELGNFGRTSEGAWQIQLNGHLMIDRVVLIGSSRNYRPEPPGRGPGPGRPDHPGRGPGYGPGHPDRPPAPPMRPRIEYYEGGSERVLKLIETTKEFRTRHFDEQVFTVRVMGTKERVRILRALAELHDGQVIDLPELRTVVREGQEAGAILNGLYVRKVIITAVSDNLSGSRGEYRLDFGVRGH